MIEVFPLDLVLDFSPVWLESLMTSLIRPTYLLMTLLLVASIAIMTLKRFEDANLEKKLWNIPIIIGAVTIWPMLVFGIKELIDAFNTFLINDIFNLTWSGEFSVSFKETPDVQQSFGWLRPSTWGRELLNTLAVWFLVLTRNLIYAFYVIFLFSLTVLGPFILAKGILSDEIETFIEVIKEIIIIFLWQTAYVIMVGLIYPQAAQPGYLLQKPDLGSLGWILILGVLTLFIPQLTRKFANHLGTSVFPPVYKEGLFLGAAALGSTVGLGAAAVGLSAPLRLAIRVKEAAKAARPITSGVTQYGEGVLTHIRETRGSLPEQGPSFKTYQKGPSPSTALDPAETLEGPISVDKKELRIFEIKEEVEGDPMESPSKKLIKKLRRQKPFEDEEEEVKFRVLPKSPEQPKSDLFPTEQKIPEELEVLEEKEKTKKRAAEEGKHKTMQDRFDQWIDRKLTEDALFDLWKQAKKEYEEDESNTNKNQKEEKE